MKNLLFIAVICLFASCMRNPDQYQQVETKEYILLDYDAPKHFYVDIKDVQTGQIFNHVYVSKHFNEYEQLVKGSSYRLKRGYYEQEGREVYEFFDVYESLQSYVKQ